MGAVSTDVVADAQVGYDVVDTVSVFDPLFFSFPFFFLTRCTWQDSVEQKGGKAVSLLCSSPQ